MTSLTVFDRRKMNDDDNDDDDDNDEEQQKQWDVMYKHLQDYKREYGDCLVSKEKNNKKEDKPIGAEFLAQWVGRQRIYWGRKNTKRLSEERIRKLEDIGFVWQASKNRKSIHQKQWEIMFERMKEYKMENGDCLVTRSYDEKGSGLGRWVSTQRISHARLTLSQKRVSKLEEIGFVWSVLKCCGLPVKTTTAETTAAEIDRTTRVQELTTQWELMFERIKEYKMEHGDCLVARSYDEKGSGLGKWVSSQRISHTRLVLSQERISKLEEIGFVWSVRKCCGRQLKTTTAEIDRSPRVQELTTKAVEPDQARIVCKKERTIRKQETGSNNDGNQELSPALAAERKPKQLAESQPSSHAHLYIGTRVAVYWSDDDKYYEGTISGRFGRTALVEYDDGGSEWVDAKTHKFRKLLAPDDGGGENDKLGSALFLKVGIRVSVWWPTEQEHYPATVTEIRQEKRIPHFIKYDDGDEEWINLECHTFSRL